jgi:hypothetical protein
MKINSLRSASLLAVAIVSLFASVAPASAQVEITVGAPPPPPPPHVYARWAPPYRGAVWIAGHNEWVNGGWVWVGGYYGYPPRPGAVWIPGHYRNHHWRPGHWR